MWLQNKKQVTKEYVMYGGLLVFCVDSYTQRKIKKSEKPYIKILVVVISGGGIMGDFYLYVFSLIFFLPLHTAHVTET